MFIESLLETRTKNIFFWKIARENFWSHQTHVNSVSSVRCKKQKAMQIFSHFVRNFLPFAHFPGWDSLLGIPIFFPFGHVTPLCDHSWIKMRPYLFNHFDTFYQMNNSFSLMTEMISPCYVCKILQFKSL